MKKPLLVLLALALPMLAHAQEAGNTQRFAAQMEARFAAADINHDGQLSREEASRGMPMVSRNFDVIAGGKDFVTLDDLRAAMAQWATAHSASQGR